MAMSARSTGRAIMRIFVIAGALVAVIGVTAAEIANNRTEQPRIRAADISKEVPKSADDRRIIDDNVVAYATANEAIKAARQKARETLPRFVSLMKSGMKAT